MRIVPCCIAIVTFLFSSPAVFAEEIQWKLVWEDNFERQEVGGGWYVANGKASIENGRLLLQGPGATILTERTFKPDVRLEFDAEAQPGLPPCDLSAAIGANKDHGCGYLLAFGGQSNRVNQILGPGVRLVDEKPAFVIEHGERYYIAAQAEGKRLTYMVNGVRILDARAADRAADSLPELIMNRSGMTAAIRLAALGPENNPFYYKARFYEARYHYWNGAEGGSERMKQQAVDWMSKLKKLWPENTILRQYTGEQTPWGVELNADTERHPAWAAYLREAYARQIKIMELYVFSAYTGAVCGPV